MSRFNYGDVFDNEEPKIRIPDVRFSIHVIRATRELLEVINDEPSKVKGLIINIPNGELQDLCVHVMFVAEVTMLDKTAGPVIGKLDKIIRQEIAERMVVKSI